MKRFLLLLLSLHFALQSYAYSQNNIKWIADNNVYITTVANTIAYRLPYYSSFRAEYLEEPTVYRACIEYTDFKQKKLKKPQTLKVRGYANKSQQSDYDTYVVEIKDILYFIPGTSVKDNSSIDAENERLNKQLDSLTLSIEQARIEYEREYHSIKKAYTDSLEKYKYLKLTLPLTIKSVEKQIEDDFKAIEDEEHNDWYNGLSASAKRTYDNVMSFSSGILSDPNSVGGCDYTLHYKNKSNKTIKYVNFTIDFYNAVNDRVYCEIQGGSSRSCKDTGPVYPEEWGGGTWDCVIYNYSADYAKISHLSIIYTDGSSTSVSASDVKQLLSEPLFLLGSPKAIAKFGGSIINVKSKAVAPYKKKLQNIDNDIKKWKERVSDINTETFSVSYRDRDDEHRRKFFNLSDLKSKIKKKQEKLYLFKAENFFD